MDKMLQDYDRLTGFEHRVDISELRERVSEWPSDTLVDRESVVENLNQVRTLLDDVEQEEFSAGRSFPNYDNIVTKQRTTVSIRENSGRPGVVSVFLNGDPVETGINVTGGRDVPLILKPGPNTVTVEALNPSCNPNPETYRIEFGNNFYGDDFYLMTVQPGNSQSWTIGLPIVTINGNDHPEAAKHVEDYLNTRSINNDSIWTLDRPNKDQRRSNAESLYRAVEGRDPISRLTGFDLDEVPFAAVRDGGFAAFMRPIPSSDNEGAGATFQNQINSYGPENKKIPDDHDFQIRAINTHRSKAKVGRAVIDDTINGTGGIDYMYGLTGNDTLRGFGSNDVMFGNRGNDRLLGGTGNDALFGNGGKDTLIGGQGDDALVGGLGIDVLTGDGLVGFGIDTFVLQSGTRYRGDRVTDFQVGVDTIGIEASDFTGPLVFSFRNGTYTGGFTGAWIQQGNNDMMFLESVSASSLNSSIFTFLG